MLLKNKKRYQLTVSSCQSPVPSSSSGYTLLELIIVTFIIGTVVVGVFGLFTLSLRTGQEAERRVVAIALANERMEMVRNLPYADVGTVGGVPAGSIPQQETVVRNAQEFVIRTDIRYVDDPFDGHTSGSTAGGEKVTICHKPGTPAQKTLEVDAAALDAHLAHGDYTGACGTGGEGTGAGDEFNADYKQVRVEVSWTSPNNPRPILLITYVAPQGIEGGELGGTLDFQVLSATGQGIEGAAVRLVNDAVVPPIDVNMETNVEGRVVLPGLPESSGSYELTVTKTGYTTEQTYDASPTFVPDVDHTHLSIILKEVTSKTFFIDLLSSVTVSTVDEDNKKVKNVAYHWQGTKTIGTDGAGDPVYVVNEDVATNANGRHEHDQVVWDTYTLTIDGQATGWDIKESSLLLPLVVKPADNLQLELTLVPHTPISLRVTVATPDGLPVDNATVTLDGNGFNGTLGTGEVGQVYFGDLPANGNYTLTIDAPGFEEYTQIVSVENTTQFRAELTPDSE